MYKKLKIFCLSFLMILLTLSIPVQAAEKQDDNLKVNYLVEKTSEKDATIKINVQNISNHVLKNIHLQNDIPSSFEVEGENELTIESLNSSESKEITINVKLKNNVVNDENQSNTTSTDNDSNSQNQNNLNLTDKDSNSQNQKETSSVQTGDSIQIGRWIIALFISVLVVCGIIKAKKKKSILSLLLVAAMLLNTTSVVKAAEVINKEIQVKEHIVLNNIDYEFGLNISYAIENEEEIENPDTLTRGEWINRLVDAMDYEDLEVTIDEPYFTDTVGTDVEESINYAVAYRIVDLDDTEFHPYTLASREFIAVTTVKALGFQPQEDLSCADSEDVKDLKNAYLAVKLGIIDLVDDHFYPAENGTVGLAEQALNVVKTVLASTEVSDVPYSNIAYQDGVIVLEQNEVVNDGSNLIVNSDSITQKISAGSIVAVRDIACYEVTSVQNTENGIVLETTEAEIQDAIKSMNFEGELYADFSQFEPAEGVVVNLPATRTVTTPDLGSMPFTLSISDNVKVKGKVDAKISVSAKADVDFGWKWPPIDCKNLYFRLDPDLDVEAGIYVGDADGAIDQETYDKVKKAFENGNRCKGSINLGKVPVVGIPGVRVYIDLGLAYDANGFFKLIWNYNGQVGFQIYENNPRGIYSATSTLTPQLGGEIKLGPEIAAVLKTAGYDLFDLSTSAGAQGKGDITLRPTGMVCSDLGVNVYWDMSVLKNSKLAEWFNWGWSYNIWDAANSPLKINGHAENWSIVPECTYVEPTVPSDELQFNGHKYKFYNDSMTWEEAKTFCEQQGGHLVTISSEDEQSFLEDNCTGEKNLYWIGLQEIGDNWGWVTGEEVSYTNWATGEPNEDFNDTEYYAQMYGKDYDDNHLGEWNDSRNDSGTLTFYQLENVGFICEWDSENITENILEFGGHKYKLYNDKSMSWEEAKTFCEEQGGHLVTITSADEQDAIYEYAKQFDIHSDIWIGVSDTNVEGDWSHWITGEEVTFTNWGTGEPDNYQGIEQDYGVICMEHKSGSGYDVQPGQWDDIAENGETASGFFICEWE